MKKIIQSILILILVCCYCNSNARLWFPIIHRAGTEDVGGNDVTVTPTSIYVSYNYGYLSNGIANCGVGPYYAGFNGPGGFEFAFAQPVSRIRIRIWIVAGDEISFRVNGLPYTLTTANVFNNQLPCNPMQAVITGGNLQAGNRNAGAEVIISLPGGGIHSLEVQGNAIANSGNSGVIYNSGALFSIDYFWGVSGSNLVCTGDTLKLFAHPDYIPGGIASYSWTGPNSFRSDLQYPYIPSVTMAQEGMYVSTISSLLDTLTDSVYVTIHPTPVTEIVVPDPVCAANTLMLVDTTTLPGVNYYWTGPNGFRSSQARPVIPNVQPGHSGVYTLTTVSGECFHTTSAQVKVLQPSHHKMTDFLCRNKHYDFNGNMLNIPGLYRDTLIAANGCDSVVSLDLVQLPEHDMQFHFEQKDKLCIGDTLSFTIISSMYAYFQWYANELRLGQEKHQQVYLNNIVNNIMVIGTSENNCADTVKTAIVAEGCCEMFIPNAFSPNGDGNNDRFGGIPHGNLSNYSLNIFNRWGQRIFTSASPADQWDGTFQGKTIDPGTYFYQIIAECLDRNKIKRHGDVILIR